jgi:UMF1 family MFS transporter
VVGWCLFDFANSSYTTLIITVVFAVYFREVVVDAADNRGDQLWGLANFIAMLIVALASPVLGAIADEAGRRKSFLILTTLQTVIATALLVFVTPGRIVTAIALYVVATVGFEAGYVFYNSFLPDLSTPRTIGRISGWGWGIGFVGGLTALVVCLPWIGSELRDAEGAIRAAAAADRRTSFLVVAAFYLVFALPALVWLREARAARGRPATAYVQAGFRRVARTVGQLRRYRQVAKFILASLFFNDAITTVIVFSATYATVTFQFGSRELFLLFLVMNGVAFPATVFAGHLADTFGARRTLIVTLMLWIGVVLAAFAAQGKPLFWAMAVGAAAGMGATQAVGRSFMAQIAPPARQAEFFGFYVTSGKFASITGPLIFGTVSAWTGSQRLAVLSLLPWFLASLALMFSIDEVAARRAADPFGRRANSLSGPGCPPPPHPPYSPLPGRSARQVVDGCRCRSSTRRPWGDASARSAWAPSFASGSSPSSSAPPSPRSTSTSTAWSRNRGA